MRTIHKKKTTKLPVGTSTSTPATVSDPPTASAATTTPSNLVVNVTAPPDFPVPGWPVGFNPVHLAGYRGVLPRSGQVAAIPAAILELNTSESFVTAFGPVLPQASHLASDLTSAMGWTALRQALETYLLYVKSLEVITWKTVGGELAALDAVYQGVVAHNPDILVAFPAIGHLLEVPKIAGMKGAATRAVNAKVKTAKAAATKAAGAKAG